jgi:hypothetical protein
MRLTKGMQFPPELDATMPDAARIMLQTRMVNDWLGTNYTLDEVAEMDELTFEIMGALRQALNPPKGTK